MLYCVFAGRNRAKTGYTPWPHPLAARQGPDRNEPNDPMEQEDQYWRRNLAVCLIGSFTTIVAMTLLLPFLPLYVAELGIADQAAIAQWSGIAFGATFFAAALVAPFWGRMADRFGRKLMLVRASLGMAIAMSLMGMAHNVWELVGLRLFAGFAGGYSSGATILVATQTPKRRSGWALGMLNSGIMAGSLVGPLIGGTLPPLIGIRATFWLAGGVIFLAFLATTFLIKEEKRSAPFCRRRGSASSPIASGPGRSSSPRSRSRRCCCRSCRSMSPSSASPIRRRSRNGPASPSARRFLPPLWSRRSGAGWPTASAEN